MKREYNLDERRFNCGCKIVIKDENGWRWCKWKKIEMVKMKNEVEGM
jgi:hypothetical protein